METFVHLKPDSLEVTADTALLKAADYANYLQAAEVLEAAHQRAADIEAAAHQRAQEMEEKGYAAGLAKGKAALATQMMETVTQSVSLMANAERRLVHTVMKALKKILGEMGDEAVITGIVREVLALARDQGSVVLRLHPRQVETVRSRMNQLTAPYPTLPAPRIVADPRLEVGNCLMETEVGVVDASIETQLQAIEAALHKHFGRDTAETSPPQHHTEVA